MGEQWSTNDMSSEAIYRHPEDYDLEVGAQDIRDLPFWLDLLQQEHPQRVLEIGCGSGRLTVPLARAGAKAGFTVTGLDPEAEMLTQAAKLAESEAVATRTALRFMQGDVRALDLKGQYDAVLMPFGAAHHLHALDDQIAAWRGVRRVLRPGGLFVVDVSAPDLAMLAQARDGTPRREDLAVGDAAGRSLHRTAATTYDAATQRAMLNFEYTLQDPDGERREYASPFAMHVYYPRELELLFRMTGFRLERMVGSYAGEPFADRSPLMIAIGRADRV
jgi:ubiquinone/menaquinone biosynthesis C-methylase UbiE